MLIEEQIEGENRIEEEQVEAVTDFLGSKIIAHGACSHEIRR